MQPQPISGGIKPGTRSGFGPSKQVYHCPGIGPLDSP